ncbi:MAG: hypothetical protein H5U00_11790 [Clostridia bacterium]|nr:hypothetical protein [Clostridia bacterium]
MAGKSQKPKYDLREYAPYAKAEDEYLALIRQKNQIYAALKEEAARLRRDADQKLHRANLMNLAAQAGQESPEKAKKAVEEAEQAIEAAHWAEEKARRAEQTAAQLDDLIAEKNRALAALRKEAAKQLLPKIRADHAPAVARVAKAMRELAAAVAELEQVRDEAAPILNCLEKWLGVCPRFPEADLWLQVISGTWGRFTVWLDEVKEAGFEVD